MQRHSVTLGDLTQLYYFAAAAFGSATQSKGVFDRAERKLRTGTNDVGVLRLKDSDSTLYRLPAAWVVVVVGVDEGVVKRGERMLRDGDPWDLPDEVMNTLAMRRVRVAFEQVRDAKRAGKPVPQVTSHRLSAAGGMELNSDGTVRPRVRGQG